MWPVRSGVSSLAELRGPRRGIGALAVLVLFGGVGAGGMVMGGHDRTLREEFGRLRDVAGRLAGFGIKRIDVEGARELLPEEIVIASGINSHHALPFLDVAAVRARLRAVPMIEDVTVRSYYPDRVVLAVTERQPFALWQHEGRVAVVAADGTVIDTLRDDRFLRLPHLVGAGANLRAREAVALLAGVPTFRREVRAMTLVAERRWTLRLRNGVDILLPEENPAAALAAFLAFDATSKVLARDILQADLRLPGRITLRLTEETAAARREHFQRTLPKVRGRA